MQTSDPKDIASPVAECVQEEALEMTVLKVLRDQQPHCVVEEVVYCPGNHLACFCGEDHWTKNAHAQAERVPAPQRREGGRARTPFLLVFEDGGGQLVQFSFP